MCTRKSAFALAAALLLTATARAQDGYPLRLDI